MLLLENKPTEMVLQLLNALSYVFILTAFAAGVAWIYYVAVSAEDGYIGHDDGKGKDDTGEILETIQTMFQGTVAASLLYFIFRHHFSNSHA